MSSRSHEQSLGQIEGTGATGTGIALPGQCGLVQSAMGFIGRDDLLEQLIKLGYTQTSERAKVTGFAAQLGNTKHKPVYLTSHQVFRNGYARGRDAQRTAYTSGFGLPRTTRLILLSRVLLRSNGGSGNRFFKEPFQGWQIRRNEVSAA